MASQLLYIRCKFTFKAKGIMQAYLVGYVKSYESCLYVIVMSRVKQKNNQATFINV